MERSRLSKLYCKKVADEMKENQVNRNERGGGEVVSSMSDGSTKSSGRGHRRVVSWSDDSTSNNVVEEKKSDDGSQPQRRISRSNSGNSSSKKPLGSSKRWGSGGKLNKANGMASPARGAGDASSSSKSLISGIRKQLSSRFTSGGSSPSPSNDKKKGGGGGGSSHNLHTSGSFDNDDDSTGEDDPVMTIFASRNTQRVRFTLEGAPPGPAYSPPDSSKGEELSSPSSSRTRNKDESNDEAAGGGCSDRSSSERGSSSGIKSFMSRALFGNGSKSSRSNLDEEMKREVAELDGSLVWESAETPTGPEVIHTQNSNSGGGGGKRSNSSRKIGASGGGSLTLSFEEDPKAREAVVKLLNKARRAEHIRFKYEYAVKCYLKALSILKKAKYPDDHPTVLKTVELLNNAHHTLSSYKNSANIVKMGIKNEDSGELVKALKMYTIAYRIRRDNLTSHHPSLVVLLNMLGSIQIKRGELKEAMQIYELALQDSPVIYNAENGGGDVVNDKPSPPVTGNLLAKSVTYREMGTIFELWQEYDQALKSYHKSLDCITDWKNALRGGSGDDDAAKTGSSGSSNAMEAIQFQRTKSIVDGAETGEMELFLGPEDTIKSGMSRTTGCSKNGNPYESFFPPSLDGEIDRSNGTTGGSAYGSSSSNNKDKKKPKQRDSFADMDLALTLHQIAQLHRFRGDFGKSLDAYTVALRGMKYALGKHHPNVAAILGNIGNLQKERGDLDAAYFTYQEVLGIESYRLGLSHPDVAITLHNIATIDAARGNHEHSLQLYRKVIGLQKKLFGENHHSVAVTAACMGEVYEKLGEVSNAMESFEEAMRIKAGTQGRHSLDVGRLLHKLGKLAFRRGDYMSADSFVSRAVLIYRLNKIDDNHEWAVDANRDAADIDGAIALGNTPNQLPVAVGQHFGEC